MREEKRALPLRITVALAMLTAVSIVCGKYLAVNIGSVIRISFENMPIIFAGAAFGPVSGILVGAVADLVGCVMVGYGINPVVTVGAAAIGLISGIMPRILSRLPMTVRLALTVATAHIIGSVLIKTFGLAAYYDMPLGILMLWRLLNYLLVGGCELLILTLLFRSKMLSSQLASLGIRHKNATRGGSNAKKSNDTVTLDGKKKDDLR